jgi:hypothetical protein
MLRRLVLVAVVLGCSGLGCGLRDQPLSWDGAVVTPGTGGSANAGGRGGTAGKGGAAGRMTDGGPDDVPACTPGSACPPANPCHVGQTACSEGVASCTDTQQPQANGTVCGTDKVCMNGSCATCSAGGVCSPANVCRTGTLSCATGVSVCTESGNQPNGTSCGTGMVCLAGQCAACADGASCVPSNPCHQGSLACATGTPVCNDKGTLLAAGTGCGTNKVCGATGSCVSCTVGASCNVSGKPCRTGTTACDTGAAVCTESGNVSNGTSCGTNMVCSGGTCAACTVGMACTPANPCHSGQNVCSPSISCSDTGNNLVNGTVCGTNMVCSNGACGACTTGASCTPATACRTGATSCVTGMSVCAETGNVANGTSCGEQQGVQRRNLWCLHGRGDLHARDRVPHGNDVVRDGDLGLCGDGERGERDLVREQQGVQRGNVQQLHSRNDLHAHERVSDGSDVVRDGDLGLRGDGERGERDLVREQQGVQRGNVQQLHGRRQLRAERPLPAGDIHLPDGHRDLSGDGAGARRNDLRQQSGLQRGELRALRFGRDLFDWQRLQTLGDDLLHDGEPGLPALRQRALRDALRGATVLYGRRGDAGSGL